MTKNLLFLLVIIIQWRAFAFRLTHKKLENGLEILFVENHSVPLVTVKLVARNGAFVETDEFDGLSHLYEHMFFKANRDLPDQEAWINFTRAHGMNWNGATSTEFVYYYFVMHRKNLAAGLKIMNSSIRFPLFDPGEVEKEKKVVLSEYDASDAEPTDFFHRELLRAAYGKYFSFKNVIGSRKVVETAGREKLETIRKRFYVPNNCLLIIAGDIHPEMTMKIIQKLYSDWKKAPDPFEKLLPSIPPFEKSKFVIVDRDVKLAVVKMLFNGPGVFTDRKGTYAADLLSAVMGHLNSRFHRELVETGIARSAAFWYSTQKVYGEIYFYLKVRPENLKKAMQVLKGEIHKMQNLQKYIEPSLIKEALTALEIDELYSRESSTNFSDKIGFWWSVSDIDYYLSYLESIKRVTIKDMQGFFDRYVKGRPFVGGVLISKRDQEKYQIDRGVFK